MTTHEMLLVKLALTEAEACFGYDYGSNDETQEARYEEWWAAKGEDAAETGATSDDVRRDVVERLRAAVEIIECAVRSEAR